MPGNKTPPRGEDTIDLGGRIRGVPVFRLYVSSSVFALIARFLPFLTSGFRLAISQTSCTPLELSEIGPEEERPCPSSKSKRREKKGRKREEARAERRRKVIFRPWRFQSTSFSTAPPRRSSPVLACGPEHFLTRKHFYRRISRKGSV